MRGYIDTLSAKYIYDENSNLKIPNTYDIFNISIPKNMYLYLSVTQTDMKPKGIKIHTPFVIEWDKESKKLNLKGIVFSTNNTFEQNIHCCAATVIATNLGIMIDDVNDCIFTRYPWESKYSDEEILQKIINTANNKKFRKEIMSILQIGKIKAQIPDVNEPKPGLYE